MASLPTTPPAFPFNPLHGLTVIQHAFDYLDGPTPVLSASLTCRRWRILATGDAVWRSKYEREELRG